jgi:hypothetical protein
VIPVLLHSSSPSVVLETCIGLTQLLNHPTFSCDAFLPHRIAIFHHCLLLIQVALIDYLCVSFDRQWSEPSVLMAVLDLSAALVQYNSGYLVREVLQSVLVDRIDTFAFGVIVKIMARVLKEPTLTSRLYFCRTGSRSSITVCCSFRSRSLITCACHSTGNGRNRAF